MCAHSAHSINKQLLTPFYSYYFQLLSRYEGHDDGEWAEGYSSSTTGSGGGARKVRQKVRSVLYSFDPVNLRLHPSDLPIKVKIKQVISYIRFC